MNLSSMDLNLLLVLDAVLVERSVVGAARRLHVTSPAISNALGRLRGALGDPVVTRCGRGIVPTPRALQLAPIVARALRELDGAIGGGFFDPTSFSGQFTLAIADAGQIARLPGLAQRMAKELPRAKLRVIGIDTMVALGGLEGTEVDMAIGVPSSRPGMHRLPLYHEQAVLVARSAHARLREVATQRALERERYVDVQIAFGQTTREVEAGFERLGMKRDVAAIVPTFTAAATLVAATDLLATIPESVVTALGGQLGLRTMKSPLRMDPTPMHLWWHERTHRDPAMQLFRERVVVSSGGSSLTGKEPRSSRSPPRLADRRGTRR